MDVSLRALLRLSCTTLALFVALGGVASGADKKKTKPAKEAPAAKTAAATAKPAEVVARVNGTAITRDEVDRAVKILLAQSGVREPVEDELMKKAKAAAVNQLVASEILYQAGIKMENKELDKEVEEQIAQRKAQFQSPAEYEKALKETGLTEKDLQTLMRKEIVINSLLEKEVAAKIQVTADEVRKFYDDNTEKFKSEESVRASHILIGADENASADEKKKAKAKAESVRKKLLAGEDFAMLAKSESSCPSASRGGDLGVFAKGQMVPEFEKAAFDLKPGDISEVVETKFGYHVIKVQEKKPAGTATFDEAKNNIEAYLKSQKIQQGVNDYLEQLRKEAKVEMPEN